MKKNILSLSLLFLLAKGIFAQNSFAPDQLDGLKILFHYGQNEVSILEFTESAAYEMDDEAGLNREFEGDYEAQTDGNIVSVTIFEQNGAKRGLQIEFYHCRDRSPEHLTIFNIYNRIRWMILLNRQINQTFTGI